MIYSITSSAATSRPGGTVRPSAFAVFRLSVVSYLVGACTGRSAGAVPRKPVSGGEFDDQAVSRNELALSVVRFLASHAGKNI
jgi:hypothetical protein